MTCLTPIRASSKQPSDLPHFVSLAHDLHLLCLLWMLSVTQAMVWCWFRHSTLSHLPQLQLLDTALHCALCHVPSHYHHPSHLSWCHIPGFRQGSHISRGINPKQLKKPKSKSLQVSIQIKAPVTAGADVFCYQAARTSEQLSS